MALKPASMKASRIPNDVFSSIIQPKTLPPSMMGARWRSDCPRRRFSMKSLHPGLCHVPTCAGHPTQECTAGLSEMTGTSPAMASFSVGPTLTKTVVELVEHRLAWAEILFVECIYRPLHPSQL